MPQPHIQCPSCNRLNSSDRQVCHTCDTQLPQVQQSALTKQWAEALNLQKPTTPTDKAVAIITVILALAILGTIVSVFLNPQGARRYMAESEAQKQAEQKQLNAIKARQDTDDCIKKLGITDPIDHAEFVLMTACLKNKGYKVD